MATAFPRVYGAGAGAFGLPMPATPPKTEKPQRETWRDWTPSGSAEPSTFLSRADFLERLKRRGIQASERDLRYWEYEGFLPRPVRRWDPQTKTSRQHYPVWAMAAVFALRELQGQGHHLRDTSPLLRASAVEAATRLSELLPHVTAEDLQQDHTTEEDVVDTIVLAAAMETIADATFFGEVRPAILRYIDVHERYGTAIHPDRAKEVLSAALVVTYVDGEEKRLGGFRVPDAQGGFRQRQILPDSRNDIK